MRIPTIRGIIDRRILVNYRVDPAVLAAILPAPFRPKLVHGLGMAGICLIRLKHVRPAFAPRWIGISSENAAHRVAVEWDERGTTREGVYVRRRDTNSWFNTWAGGRVFPGIHGHARFAVEETANRYCLSVLSDDRATNVMLRGHRTDDWPSTSVFNSCEEASQFFEAGAVGYSTTRHPGRFQGLELRCRRWHAEPLHVDEVHSSFFDDALTFPRGAAEFDCALLMRDIDHQWHGKPDLCCLEPRSRH